MNLSTVLLIHVQVVLGHEREQSIEGQNCDRATWEADEKSIRAHVSRHNRISP